MNKEIPTKQWCEVCQWGCEDNNFGELLRKWEEHTNTDEHSNNVMNEMLHSEDYPTMPETFQKGFIYGFMYSLMHETIETKGVDSDLAHDLTLGLIKEALTSFDIEYDDDETYMIDELDYKLNEYGYKMDKGA